MICRRKEGGGRSREEEAEKIREKGDKEGAGNTNRQKKRRSRKK